MKIDKELLKIWENKELSYEDLNKYENLNIEDKTRIFDLIMEKKIK